MLRKQSLIYKVINFFDILPLDNKPAKKINYKIEDNVLLDKNEFNQALIRQTYQNWNSVGQLIKFGMSKEINATK